MGTSVGLKQKKTCKVKKRNWYCEIFEQENSIMIILLTIFFIFEIGKIQNGVFLFNKITFFYFCFGTE
jgi:hypothetical protein